MIKLLLVSDMNRISGVETFTTHLETYLRHQRTLSIEHLVVFQFTKPKKYNKLFAGRLIFIRKINLIIRAFIKLKNNLKEIRPDVLISTGPHSNLYCLIIKTLFLHTIKVIAVYQHPEFYRARNPLRMVYVRLKRRLYQRADLVIFISDSLQKEAQKFLHLNKQRNMCIYDDIDRKLVKKLSLNCLDQISTHIKEKLQSKDTKKLFMVGRLDKEKDHVTLMQAVAIARSQLQQDIQLFIVGGGPYTNNLMHYAHAQRADYITFLGAVINPFYFLRFADLYVHSSLREGLGLAIIEAMTLGKPVLATNCPYGPWDILMGGRYGLLTPVGKSQKMADKICFLLSHKDAYHRYCNLSKKRSSKFDISLIGKDYLLAIRQVYARSY